MKCKERMRLLIEYEKAIVDAFLASFSKGAGDAALAAHGQLLGVQERSEKNISKTHFAYEQHIIEHGCTFQNSSRRVGVRKSQRIYAVAVAIAHPRRLHRDSNAAGELGNLYPRTNPRDF